MSPIVSEHTVSEQYESVVGVDTHAATHTFALVAAATGALLTHAEFPTSPAGLSRAHSGCSSGSASGPRSSSWRARLVRCHRDRAAANGWSSR